MTNEDFEYTIDKIDDENITKMLNTIPMQVRGYMFGTLMPKFTSHALLGSLASFTVLNTIVAFDNSAIYFFILSRLTNKKIVSRIKVPFDQITKVKVSNFLFGVAKRIHIKIADHGKLILQVNQKMKSIHNQTDSITNLMMLLNQ